MLFLSSALAATLSVEADGSGTYTTLAEAIAAASDGDTVEVGPGTYTDTLDPDGRNLTVTSTDGSAATTIDATGSTRCIDVTGGEWKLRVSR